MPLVVISAVSPLGMNVNYLPQQLAQKNAIVYQSCSGMPVSQFMAHVAAHRFHREARSRDLAGRVFFVTLLIRVSRCLVLEAMCGGG